MDGLAPIVVLTSMSVTAFALFAVFLCILLWKKLRSRRRTAHSTLPTKFSGELDKSPSKVRLFFLWLMGPSSQVEPAGINGTHLVKLPECSTSFDMDSLQDCTPAPAPGERTEHGGEFERLYSRARILYTITEEKETETESEHESFRFAGDPPSSVDVVVTLPAEESEDEVDASRFFTPCSSPPSLHSPSSSPNQALNVATNVGNASPAAKVSFLAR